MRASRNSQRRVDQGAMLVVAALGRAVSLQQQFLRRAQVILIGTQLAFPARERWRLATPALHA